MSEEQKEYAIDYIMQLQEENYKLRQENKQLKKELENIKDFNNKLQASKDRLDKDDYNLAHILTELEECLKEETIELYDKDNPMLLDQSYITYATERKMAYMYILDKIQELKEKYK